MTRATKLASLAFAATALAAAQGAAAYTLYNTLGGIENGGDSLASAGPFLNDWIKTYRGATLTSVTFNLELTNASTGSFEVFAAKIDPSAASGISQYAVLSTVNDSSLTTNFGYYTYTPSTTYAFDPNAFYVVGLNDSNNSAATLGNTVDPSVLSRPSVVAGKYYYNNGGVQANSGGPYELSVNVAGVPEPATWVMMLAGFAGLGGVLRNARRRIVIA